MTKPLIEPQGDTHYHTLDNVLDPVAGGFVVPKLDDPEAARAEASRVAAIPNTDPTGGYNPMARDPVTGELVHTAPRTNTWSLPPQPTATASDTATASKQE